MIYFIDILPYFVVVFINELLKRYELFYKIKMFILNVLFFN